MTMNSFRACWLISLALCGAALFTGPRRSAWRVWCAAYLIGSIAMVAACGHSWYRVAWESFVIAEIAFKAAAVAQERPTVDPTQATVFAVAVSIMLMDEFLWPAIEYESVLSFCAFANLALGIWSIGRDRIMTGYLILCAAILFATPEYVTTVSRGTILLDCIAFSSWIAKGMYNGSRKEVPIHET
jgi:hypothetical protein